MKILSYIQSCDFYLLCRCQLFTDWLQDLTGYNCFVYAHAFLISRFLFSAIPQAIHHKIFLIILDCIVYIPWYIMLEMNRKRCERNPNTLNIAIMSYQFVRVFMTFTIFCGFFVMFFAKDFSISLYISDIFFFLYTYFASCTPKPPSQSKVRKWIDSLSTSHLVPMPNES